jgi:hypothetical protein
VYLHSDLIAVAEEILTSDMVGLAGHIRNIVHQRMAAPTIFAHVSVEPVIQKYTQQFVTLAEAYNIVVTDDHMKIRASREMWRKDVMPAVGSARSS